MLSRAWRNIREDISYKVSGISALAVMSIREIRIR